MPVLRGLRDDASPSAKAGASFNGAIGPFERLHGHDDPAPNHNGLADVGVANLPGDVQPVADVMCLPLVRGTGGEHTRAGKVSGHEEGGGKHVKSVLRQQVGNPAERRVGVERVEPRHLRPGHVVVAGAEEAQGMDLAGQDRGLASGGPSPLQEELERPQRNPLETVAKRTQRAGAAAQEAQHRDAPNAGATRVLDDEPRIRSPARHDK